MDILKVLKFVADHADVGIKAIEAVKHLFSKGSDKQLAATEIINAAGALTSSLTDEEKASTLVPAVQDAIKSLIDAKVAVMNAEAKVRIAILASKESH